MRIQSIPALRARRVGIVVFLIGCAAAAAHTAGQMVDATDENEPVSVSAPGSYTAGASLIPAGTSGSSLTLPSTANERFHLALRSYESVLEQNRTRGNREGEAENLAEMANAYRALQEESKAVDFFQSAVTIFHELDNRENEAAAIAHVGDVYREWGFPDTALRYYRKALAMYSATTDRNGRAAALNNGGAAWLKLDNRGKCIEWFRQAADSYRGNHDARGEALALSNLGAAYLYFSDDPEKAIRALEDAASKMQLLGDNAGAANALEMTGFAWLKARNEATAALNLQHARALYQALGDVKEEARVAGDLMMLEQGDHPGRDRLRVVSVISPKALVLTAARLQVLEISR